MGVKTLENLSPFDLPGQRSPIEQHKIIYDDLSAPLEGLYFWLLDYMTDVEGWKVTKVVDNLTLAPGASPHADSLRETATMQGEAMKILRAAQRDVQAVLTLVPELKSAKERLSWFEDSRSEDPAQRDRSMALLRGLWREESHQRHREVNVLWRSGANQADVRESLPEYDESVRVNSPWHESDPNFFGWLKAEETQLKTRLHIETARARMLLNSLKLYARWLQPLLRAANRLHPGSQPGPSLVTAFNSAFLEVTLLGQEEYPVHEDIQQGVLPKMFKKPDRPHFYSVVVVEMLFRARPEKNPGGGYGYTGRAELTFTSYALREDELDAVANELDRDALADLMAVCDHDAAETVRLLEFVVENLLEEPADAPLQEKGEDTNPFSALFSFLFDWHSRRETKPGTSSKRSAIELHKDSLKGSVIRSRAILRARRNCSRLFQQFKASKGGINLQEEMT